MLIRKAWNVARGLIQSWGTVAMKKHLWDSEYAGGQWDCLDEMDQDCLYPYIEKYVNRGSILDLGCGPGATGNELNASKYSFYTGVDISEVAIEKARRRTERNQRNVKNEYIQSDIYSYVPTRSYDVIVLGDSIYYVAERRIGAMLHRYCRYLNGGGVFIVRMVGVRPEWFEAGGDAAVDHRVRRLLVSLTGGSWARRRSILELIEHQFSVIERQLHHFSNVICVIVFRPPVV